MPEPWGGGERDGVSARAFAGNRERERERERKRERKGGRGREGEGTGEKKQEREKRKDTLNCSRFTPPADRCVSLPSAAPGILTPISWSTCARLPTFCG